MKVMIAYYNPNSYFVPDKFTNLLFSSESISILSLTKKEFFWLGKLDLEFKEKTVKLEPMK